MAPVGAVVPTGLAVRLSPVIALVLLPFTPRTQRDGIAFVRRDHGLIRDG